MNTNVLWPKSPLTIAVIHVNNDGRADFAANPFNGPLPTYAQALKRFCYVNNVPGCLLRSPPNWPPLRICNVTHAGKTLSASPTSLETSCRCRPITCTPGPATRNMWIQDNVNLTFNPATGIPYPFSDAAIARFPLGNRRDDPFNGSSDYHGFQTCFTKRMSHHWQGSLTYTLGGLWTGTAAAERAYRGEIPGSEGYWRRMIARGNRSEASAGLQRHLGGGTRLPGERHLLLRVRPADSGLLRLRRARILRITSIDRLRQDAPRAGRSIIPRDAFVGQPIHRVDMRLQQRVSRRPRGDQWLLEVFNVFNHANYGLYDTTETSPTYGQPFSSQIFRTRRGRFSWGSGLRSEHRWKGLVPAR